MVIFLAPILSNDKILTCKAHQYPIQQLLLGSQAPVEDSLANTASLQPFCRPGADTLQHTAKMCA